MKYKPSLLLNACYGMGFLVLPGAITAFVLLGSWSWIKGLCLALYATSAAYVFPRHHFAHTVTTSEEGFEYLPREESRRKSVRWASVTGYRWGAFVVRLMRVDERVHILFGYPLLIQDRRSFQSIRPRAPRMIKARPSMPKIPALARHRSRRLVPLMTWSFPKRYRRWKTGDWS